MNEQRQKELEAFNALVGCPYLEETKSLSDWVETHYAACPIKYAGAIGGRFTFSFIPTSIGTVCKVNCSCGAEHDATKYEWW